MRVNLKKVRLSFPNLFEAKAFENGQNKRYGATFLVEPGSKNDKAIKEAIAEVTKEKFPKDHAKKLEAWKDDTRKHCYTDGNKKEYDGYENMMALVANRREEDLPPRVKAADGTTDLTAKDGKPYAGCYVNAIVELYAQDGKFPGVRAQLLGVQFCADGDAFSSSRLADDAFEPVEEAMDEDDI